MASLSVCGFAGRSLPWQSRAIAGHRRPNAITLRSSNKHISLDESLPFGIKGRLRWKTAQTSFVTFASNSGKNSGDEKPGVNEGSESNGPPLLTILAGFATFFIVVWVIKSIVFWLISVIVNLASS